MRDALRREAHNILSAAADRRAIERETAAQFARASIEITPGGPLALGVLDGGPFASIRVVELARLVGAPTAAPRAEVSDTNAPQLARLYLDAGADGQSCAALAHALAHAVVRSDAVKLAEDVMAGGEHAHAQATRLAELVLSAGAATQTDAETPTGTDG